MRHAMDMLLYFVSFSGSGFLCSVGWWSVCRAIAAENALTFEEWERV